MIQPILCFMEIAATVVCFLNEWVCSRRALKQRDYSQCARRQQYILATDYREGLYKSLYRLCCWGLSRQEYQSSVQRASSFQKYGGHFHFKKHTRSRSNHLCTYFHLSSEHSKKNACVHEHEEKQRSNPSLGTVRNNTIDRCFCLKTRLCWNWQASWKACFLYRYVLYWALLETTPQSQ